MFYRFSPVVAAIVVLSAAILWALSRWLGREKMEDEAGGWWSVGTGIAGDFFSGAWFLGICGAIAFWGFDGFLYAIGLMAGWVAAMAVMGERLRGLGMTVGNFSVGGILERRFDSRAVRRAGRISMIVVVVCFLVPELVGGGALVKAVLGIRFDAAVIGLGIIMVMLMIFNQRAGKMERAVSGGALVALCVVLAGMVLGRGVRVKDAEAFPRRLTSEEFRAQLAATDVVLPNTGAWEKLHYARIKHADGGISVWKYVGMERLQLLWPAAVFTECQVVTEAANGERLVNGKPMAAGNEVQAMGVVRRLAGNGNEAKSFSPMGFLTIMQGSEVGLVKREVVRNDGEGGGVNVVYYSEATSGQDLLSVGNSETFAGVRRGDWAGRANFLSLMLGLFFGVMAVPGFLNRYGRVREKGVARAGMVVGLLMIGVMCAGSLFVGLGAMTSGRLDPTDSNGAMVGVLRGFAENGLFAGVMLMVIVWSGKRWLRAGAQAAGKPGPMMAVLIAMGLAIGLNGVNVAVLMGWAFGVVVSMNLAALVMGMYWRGTTGAGVVASMTVGAAASLVCIMCGKAFFGGFDQPALVGVPLAFLAMVGVSLATKGRGKI